MESWSDPCSPVLGTWKYKSVLEISSVCGTAASVPSFAAVLGLGKMLTEGKLDEEHVGTLCTAHAMILSV